MTKITSWRLRCRSYWHDIAFRFETLREAGEFMVDFRETKEPDESADRNGWQYSIEPIFEEEADANANDVNGETEDDIPESM